MVQYSQVGIISFYGYIFRDQFADVRIDEACRERVTKMHWTATASSFLPSTRYIVKSTKTPALAARSKQLQLLKEMILDDAIRALLRVARALGIALVDPTPDVGFQPLMDVTEACENPLVGPALPSSNDDLLVVV